MYGFSLVYITLLAFIISILKFFCDYYILIVNVKIFRIKKFISLLHKNNIMYNIVFEMLYDLIDFYSNR